MSQAPRAQLSTAYLSCMIDAAHSAVSRRLNDMQCPKDPVLVADLFDTITDSSGRYVAMAVRSGALLSWLAGTCVTALCRGSRLQYTSKR
jgi:hypothetical protein